MMTVMVSQPGFFIAIAVFCLGLTASYITHSIQKTERFKIEQKHEAEALKGVLTE